MERLVERASVPAGAPGGQGRPPHQQTFWKQIAMAVNILDLAREVLTIETEGIAG